MLVLVLPGVFSQLRLLQDAIKREEDYLAEERRREIQARAEADEEAKCAYYLAKQEERETRLRQVRTARRSRNCQATFGAVRPFLSWFAVTEPITSRRHVSAVPTFLERLTLSVCCKRCFVMQRQQQAELLRTLRAEEAQARFDYIRSRAAEVSEQDKVRREDLARRLEVRQYSGRFGGVVVRAPAGLGQLGGQCVLL